MGIRSAIYKLLTRSTSRRILARVAEVGWTAAYVDGKPPFAYTVGLGPAFEHPELIVVGLPEGPADWLFTNAVGRIKSGERFHAGATATGLIGEYDAQFVAVAQKALGRLAFAGDIYGGLNFQALQVVWPNRDGRFPWEPGVDAGFLAGQPLLGDHVTSRDAD